MAQFGCMPSLTRGKASISTSLPGFARRFEAFSPQQCGEDETRLKFISSGLQINEERKALICLVALLLLDAATSRTTTSSLR